MASLSVAAINDKVHFSGSNIKQALKECEKKLQKRPKDPYLLYWKAAVYLKFGRDDDAFAQLARLCESAPAITDPNLLRAVYFRLGERPSTADQRKALWQNAFKATNDGNVLVTWFESAASMDDWQNAQVAMVTLKNKFPKDEQYVFALPAVQQLAGDALAGKDDRNARFMRMFASKALSVAVAKGMKAEKTVDAVTTRRELRLVLQIYRKQGMLKEILEILDHPIVGIFSPLVVCDLSFVRTKLEVLEEASMWQDLWDFCVAALKQTHTPDEAAKTSYSLWPYDYAPWRALHLSHRELTRQAASDSGLVDDLNKLLEEIHDRYTDDNLRVRLLPQASITSEGDEELLKSCTAYVMVFAKEQCCFEDISPYIQRLDNDHQSKFLDWCFSLADDQDKTIQDGAPKQQAQALRTKANVLKLEYQLTLSEDQKAAKGQLEDFVIKALDVHQLAKCKDVTTCEDACALATMALVKLFYLESSLDYLVQAEIVMKELLSHSPESRKAALLQARLAAFLGNFSEAMKAWSSLKVKEILMETLSHHMFTRMAITHPFYYRSEQKGRANTDPLTQLDRILQTSDKILHTLQAFLGAEIDALQYDRLLEIQELKNNLSKSLSRKVTVIERRRTLRIRGEPVDDMYCEILDDDLDGLVDNRDLKRMWNYEHSATPRFEHLLSTGPPPGRYWLVLHLLIDDTCTVISSSASSSSPDSNHARRINITDTDIEKIANNPSSSDLAELTPAEKALIPGWVKLRALASKVLTGTDIGEAPAAVADLQAWVSGLVHGNNDTAEDVLAALSLQQSSEAGLPLLPLQRDIQTLFLVAELLQAAARLCDAASRLVKTKAPPPPPPKWSQAIPAKELAALRTAVADAFASAVRRPALDWTNRLADDAGVERLAEAATRGRTGEAVAARVLAAAEEDGEKKKKGWATDVAGLLVQGALDAMDGVLKVKLA
ncbi:cytoskeleton organization protein [Diplodia corticola]|uniref:Cytoskeleton organization protein n=1 Tax=Diplodia corticola TaxID=236234 RepID=A0A1J9QVJ3_9PEZI|nr:cytoskeleton organization protein [Diplodia corticola]OJD32409.1 cytoskeleton organization protein [Diplodia corticola]